MKALFVALGIAVTGLAACSASGTSTPTPDTVAYGQVASEIVTTVDGHRTAGASALTQADCEGERRRYEEHMTPLLDRMEGNSGGMDACMVSMGHHETPTMADTCDSMRGELTRHMGAACTSVKRDDRIAEVDRHADLMIPWAASEADRSARMGGMMGESTGMMSGNGCHM